MHELELPGEIVHAIDMGGQGGQVLGDGTRFEACAFSSSQLASSTEHACSGDSSVKVSATSQQSSWSDTSDLTNDNAFNDVMASYLGVTYPSSDLRINIEDVTPGTEYQLSLYFVEYDLDRAHFIYVDGVIQGRMNPYQLAGHRYGKASVFQLRLNATSSSIRIRLWGQDESDQEMEPTRTSKDVVIQALTLRKIRNHFVSVFAIDDVPPSAKLYYDDARRYEVFKHRNIHS